jgi:hypothetical protein
MSTEDQLLYSACTVRLGGMQTDSSAELRQIAGGRDDILAEAAGITAGSWYAWPSTHVGYELITAGMLIMACGGNGKPLDTGNGDQSAADTCATRKRKSPRDSLGLSA